MKIVKVNFKISKPLQISDASLQNMYIALLQEYKVIFQLKHRHCKVGSEVQKILKS